MRILYFSRDYTPHDHRFLTTMASEGNHEVYFLRLERGKRQTEDRPLPVGVQSVEWKGGTRPLNVRNIMAHLSDLKRILRRIKPDLVHAGPIQSCAFLTALAGFHPLASMSWGSDMLLDADRNIWWKRVTHFTLAQSDILFADCDAVRIKAEGFGYRPNHTMLFPWGIDLEHFSPGDGSEFRNRRGWEKNIILLSVRSWEPLYGVDMLVRIFCRAAVQNPDLRLILLGSGSQAPLLHSMIMKERLEERVYFGGQVSQRDLPAFYRSADLYLSASHSDGSSVSLMEALGCGLPVLVSDIPGNREWIEHGKQGWLFTDGNEDNLYQAIVRVTQPGGIPPQMRSAARNLAEERADWSKNSKKLFEGYAQVVNP